MPSDVDFQGMLYIRTRWVQVPDANVDQGYYNWCVASLMLNGRAVITRSARLEWRGEGADRDLCRRSAIMLVRNDLALRLTDIRDETVALSSPPVVGESG
jgi:hypothetical protein